jgi:acyl-coenzyme A thioesterase PaaI-like protein
MTASKLYGVVSAAEQKEMSGLEFVRGLVSGALPLNPMARTLGYDVVEAEEGRVVITAPPSGDHMNPSGTIHGGMAATRSNRACCARKAKRSWSAAAPASPKAG